MVTIGWLGAAPHIDEILANIPYFTLPNLFFINNPTDQTTKPICTHDISNDANCFKEVPFGGLIDEKIFSWGNIPFPKFSKGI
jgi:hypothetical protein